jgi:hypothetical protein
MGLDRLIGKLGAQKTPSPAVFRDLATTSGPAKQDPRLQDRAMPTKLSPTPRQKGPVR